MGGIDPAKEYMMRAMEAKKHIVTANKMLLATAGDEVFEKAEEMGICSNMKQVWQEEFLLLME